MVLTIQINGVDATIRNLTRMSQRITTESFKLTKKAALDLKRTLKKNIPINKWGQGAMHNTPTHLRNLVRFKVKNSKRDPSHLVYFDKGEDPNLALYVDQGTRAHAQPNNPIFRKKGHPGARPSPFINKSVEEVRGRMQGYADEAMKNIVR